MNRYLKFSISLLTLLGLVYAQSSVQGTVKDGILQIILLFG